MPDGSAAFGAEAFTLLSLGIFFIFLRVYARIRLVGIRNLEVDDYLMLFAIFPYAAETALAYVVGAQYRGLTNSSMTDEERAALSPDSEEYQWRVGGSRIQVIGWPMYVSVLWVVKASLAVFYLRLTNGLAGYKVRINIAFGLIGVTYIAVLAGVLGGCFPVHRYWQINPNPGVFCQPALSPLNIFMVVVLNIVTDIYLLAIPIPMLWAAQIPKVKRVGLVVLFSGGIFVMVAGLLRCVLILQNPETGPEQGSSWAVRESFVAVATSNLPLIWGWLRKKLRPIFGSLLSSDKKYKSGPQPGSIPLNDHSGASLGRGTWRSRADIGNTTTVRHDSISEDNRTNVFMHPDEASSEEIISSPAGIKKEVEFSVSMSNV